MIGTRYLIKILLKQVVEKTPDSYQYARLCQTGNHQKY